VKPRGKVDERGGWSRVDEIDGGSSLKRVVFRN